MARRTRDPKVALLSDVALFSGCSAKELTELASLVDEVDLPAGKVIAREGGIGREFFVIVNGEVVVAMPDGTSVTLGAGSFFGEMALLDGGPRVATVSAATPVNLLVMERRAFSRLLLDMPSVAVKMLVELARRLRAQEVPSPAG